MIKTVFIWTAVTVVLCLVLGGLFYHLEKKKKQTEERIIEVENRLEEIDRDLEDLRSESGRLQRIVSVYGFGSYTTTDGEEYPAVFIRCPQREQKGEENGMQKLLPFEGGKLAMMGCEHSAEVDEQTVLGIYQCKLTRDRLEEEHRKLRYELVHTGYFEFDDDLKPIRTR